ncbi:molybdopterin-guanine dinucleotide biosynthesis protein B [Alicyclobacillus sp. SO9]|uniref:molybdopterin-guanine dinucleotide biosynthesis protein B n=1 Tax=Alicyclobacillus sp. SO9 TaxID=2665646 RepID=UPI0018E7784A|nr:molybdopterin-guanine dinucleotide biosynthesis protein B [Alicyclobacillus sp. SO9]QQE78596.1 molybdopterin-guanine dinucleotide biosynthesis protein B [Alicyclobacillus sp. SO9]
MSRPAVVSVIGLKNSGKTRLVRQMLSLWTAQGLSVGVVKHDGHAVREETAAWQKHGSDTQLFAEAGAAYTLLAGGGQSLLYNANSGETEDINKLLAALQQASAAGSRPLDAVIVEGFKHSLLPKIAVIRTADQVNWLKHDKPPLLEAVVMSESVMHLAHDTWRVYHEGDTNLLCRRFLTPDGGE